MEKIESLLNPQGETVITENGIIRLPSHEQMVTDLANALTGAYKYITVLNERLMLVEKEIDTIKQRHNRFMK